MAASSTAAAQRQSDMKADSSMTQRPADSAKAAAQFEPSHHRFDLCHSISRTRCTILSALTTGLIGSFIGAQFGPRPETVSYTVGLLDGGSPLGDNTKTRCIKHCSVPATTWVLGFGGAAVGGYVGWRIGGP
jgi:hypothetical protein